jgi:hypothetical protein
MLIGDEINPNFSEVYENIATQPLSIKATRRRTPGWRRKIFRTSLAHGIAGRAKPPKNLPRSNFRSCVVHTTGFQETHRNRARYFIYAIFCFH